MGFTWFTVRLLVGFSTGALQSAKGNMPSALALDKYLLKELNRGSTAGPFLCEPIKELHI